MKSRGPLVAAAFVFFLALVSCLPILVLAASPSSGNCDSGPEPSGSVEAIAATIRELESGNDYMARAPGSTASGAYQFLDSSWAGYGGYTRALLAPPEVQDAKAFASIRAILAMNDDDPAAVPVSWYIGHVPAPGSPRWDAVPSPGAGNRLTPRQYQARWMDSYRANLARYYEGTDSTGGSSPSAGVRPNRCPAKVAVTGDYALPVERIWFDQHPEWFTKPHHDYPAADIPVPTGTPIYAAAPGVVVSTPSDGRCGIGVVINGNDGAQYTYCHGLPGSQEVEPGAKVSTGQPLMLSANTGNSTAPHLHFAIRVDGSARCPQPFFEMVTRGQTAAVTALPVAGCTF
jgi:hypothetical protein